MPLPSLYQDEPEQTKNQLFFWTHQKTEITELTNNLESEKYPLLQVGYVSNKVFSPGEEASNMDHGSGLISQSILGSLL